MYIHVLKSTFSILSHLNHISDYAGLSPSLGQEDPGGVDLDRDNFSPSPGFVLPREGGVVESFETVTALTDGPADKLPVNFLIVGRLYHPNYGPVFIVDQELTSLGIKYL